MFDEFDKTMASISEAAHKENIISKFVPATEMQNKLEEGGIHVLDVGCGRGMHIAELGTIFLSAPVSPGSTAPCLKHMLDLFAITLLVILNIRK